MTVSFPSSSYRDIGSVVSAVRSDVSAVRSDVSAVRSDLSVVVEYRVVVDVVESTSEVT